MDEMLHRLAKYQKLFVALTLIAFVYVGFLGATHSAMQMNNDGTMAIPCPFMGQAAICNMSPLQHIGMWQTMFASLPAQTTTIDILLALVLLSIVFFIYKYQSLFSSDNQIQVHRRRFRDNNLRISFFDNLRLALAKGRVHSKAY